MRATPPHRAPRAAHRLARDMAVRVLADGPASVYLHPGHVHVAAEACTITTVLGSCVSVCLFDAVNRVGGANHFLLPHHTRGDEGSSRFGPAAIRALLDGVLRAGASEDELEAKIFGGASMLASIAAARVGLANVEVARSMLQEHGIPIVSEDVGGKRGRKLMFDVADGSAWVKVI